MFVGRDRELDEMQKMYNKGGFQFPIIYGRRRIGKTKFIGEFTKDKPTIFYTATQDEPDVCLRDFTQAIKEFDTENALLQSVDSIGSWSALFDYITKLAETRQIVLVIDEYPYLAKVYPAISSVLQRQIDTKWKDTELFLILSGSSMSFMENQVLGYESPLYGRRTAQIKLKALPYYEGIKFFNNWDKIDMLYGYGICGGVPQYLEFFSKWNSLEDAVRAEFLTLSSVLNEEPKILLREELREPAIYSSILDAIASGASKSNEIATKIGKQGNTIAPYLKNLISLEIVEKIHPIESKSDRKTVYRISDNLFHFWYYFMPKCRPLIAMGRDDVAYSMKIKPHIPEYFGHIFEQICLQYVVKVMVDTMDYIYDDYGTWWGNNPAEKREEEIDIVATGENDILTCECKWKDNQVGEDVLKTLVERTGLISAGRKPHYVIFSKSGFTKELQNHIIDNMNLVGIDDLFQ